jgi:hypothetical protein
MAALMSGIANSTFGPQPMNVLDTRRRTIYEKTKKLFTEKNTFSRYRDALQVAGTPCVPFLRVCLIDLQALQSTTELIVDKKVNVDHCRLIQHCVEDICTLQIRYTKIGVLPSVRRWAQQLFITGNAIEFEKKEIEEQFRAISRSVAERFRRRITTAHALTPHLLQAKV